MNNSFSWARVGLLIRRYLNENTRQLLMSIGVVFGIFFLMALLFTSTGVINEGTGATTWLTFFGIGTLAVQVLSSLTFSSMSAKPGRIVAMMVPASKAEKFTSLMVIYNVFGPLAVLLAAVAADTLACALHLHAPFFFEVFKFLVSDVFPALKDIEFADHWVLFVELSAAVLLLIGATMLTNQALYTLGSAWWPKKSFIKTFCALYAVQMLFGIFMSMSILNVVNLFDWIGNFNLEQVSWHLVMWGVIIGWYVVIGCLFWLTWRRYKNTQLVQKFMMN